jgi:hypothetical protein
MYNIELHIIFMTYIQMQGPCYSTLTLETEGRKENHFLKQIISETPIRH